MKRWLPYLIYILFFASTQVEAQKDSTRNGIIDRLKEKEVTGKAIGSITRKPEADTVFNYKSEDAFIPYKGKIIRKITVNQIQFNRLIQDTTKVMKNSLIKIGEGLHTDTKERTVRNNLFIREGQPLNPYRLADNERYIRDLNFIKDARIYVIQEFDDSDSVDLLIMTRDVFSIGVSGVPESTDEFSWLLQEANLLGSGLKIAYSGIFDSDRRPQFGFSNSISKNSIAGTFIDGTIGHTTIDDARSLGNENESAFYLRLNRPLFMPYARWAGGVELSRNWSENVFSKPDSSFAKYAYSVQDYWAGFTFGELRSARLGKENRNRRFFSARVLDQHFISQPDIELNPIEELRYSNRLLFLSQLTLFKQNFYKTKYVFGFGRTEDIPYGYSVSLTAGWERQAGIERPYAGGDITKSFTNNGNIITLIARAGGYFRNSNLEDTKVDLGAIYFSKVYELSTLKIRHSFEFGVSRFYNRNIKNQLDINGNNGLEGFRSTNLFGDTRLRTRVQSIMFTNWKLIGFNFAIVPQIDLAFLSLSNQSAVEGKFLQGYSLGLRTRNENLIFNTVEVRGYYYPNTVENLSNYRIRVNANLRIKYPTALVRPPETIFEL
ncbi:MAG: hypothetical protein RIB47_01025 [Cyclobacteriaceae bacterium]